MDGQRLVSCKLCIGLVGSRTAKSETLWLGRTGDARAGETLLPDHHRLLPGLIMATGELCSRRGLLAGGAGRTHAFGELIEFPKTAFAQRAQSSLLSFGSARFGLLLFSLSLLGQSLLSEPLLSQSSFDTKLLSTLLFSLNPLCTALLGAQLRGKTLRGAQLFDSTLLRALLFGAALLRTAFLGAPLLSKTSRGPALLGQTFLGTPLFSLAFLCATFSSTSLRGTTLHSATLFGGSPCFLSRTVDEFLHEIFGCAARTFLRCLNRYRPAGQNHRNQN